MGQPDVIPSSVKTLEESGIVVREFYDEHPPRAQYVLTDKGKALGPVLREMRTWGLKHGS
jgi:DNA-binding HxlR family transcriptional regulator